MLKFGFTKIKEGQPSCDFALCSNSNTGEQNRKANAPQY